VTDHSAATQAASQSGADAADETAVGGALRALRVSKGWSLEDVAARIKFAPRQIDALENQRWGELPTGISLRGLVRSYARLLGADPDTIVASLEPHMRGNAPGRLAQGTLHSPRGAMPAEEERSSSSWGWLIVILLVIVAAVAYGIWQGWLPAHWLPGWLSRSGHH
jgi:cytoskeletal protein RodZ